MIEALFFILGSIVGVSVVLAIQKLYRWIDDMMKTVENLRNQIHYLSRQKEQWTEFMFWKNEKNNDN